MSQREEIARIIARAAGDPAVCTEDYKAADSILARYRLIPIADARNVGGNLSEDRDV